MRIQLTRDSVAISDDIDAPHLRIVELQDEISLEEFVALVLESDYLAQVAVTATWSLHSGRPLAVISQDWAEAKFFNPTEIPKIADLEKDRGVPTFFFRYHQQRDPFEVFENLRLSLKR